MKWLVVILNILLVWGLVHLWIVSEQCQRDEIQLLAVLAGIAVNTALYVIYSFVIMIKRKKWLPLLILVLLICLIVIVAKRSLLDGIPREGPEAYAYGWMQMVVPVIVLILASSLFAVINIRNRMNRKRCAIGVQGDSVTENQTKTGLENENKPGCERGKW